MVNGRAFGGQLGCGAFDGDSSHLVRGIEEQCAGGQSGLGTLRSGREVETLRLDPSAIELIMELDDAVHVPKRADRHATAGWHEIRHVRPADSSSVDDRAPSPVCAQSEPSDQTHLGAEQSIEQQVSGQLRSAPGVEHQHALESRKGRGGGCLPGMIGLGRSLADKHRRAFGNGIAGQVFELARLIASIGEAGHVIALDPDLRRSAAERSLEVAARERVASAGR